MSEPELREINILDLQPTDTLRAETMSFLESLSEEEICRLEAPQVWETSEGLLISDGNNRAALFARKNCLRIKVDYCTSEDIVDFRKYYEEEVEFVLERAKQLKKQGICTLYDLLSNANYK